MRTDHTKIGLKQAKILKYYSSRGAGPTLAGKESLGRVSGLELGEQKYI